MFPQFYRTPGCFGDCLFYWRNYWRSASLYFFRVPHSPEKVLFLFPHRSGKTAFGLKADYNPQQKLHFLLNAENLLILRILLMPGQKLRKTMICYATVCIPILNPFPTDNQQHYRQRPVITEQR